MNPIEELIAEHEGIKVSLEILDRISRRMVTAKPVELKDAQDLVEFYKVFVDTCHHGKEEDLLFPALESVGVSRNGGPIGVMLAEHDAGRAEVRGLAKALEDDPVRNPAAANAFRKHAEDYINLLRAHIEKENNVLFRIAEQHLSTEQKNELAEGGERIEQERVGVGRHEAFHKMLDNLLEKYPGKSAD